MFKAGCHLNKYGAAMLELGSSTSIWRPDHSVNIWNLLLSSRTTIFCTEQTSI